MNSNGWFNFELEIGFGHSCILFQLADINPKNYYLGVEIESSCFDYQVKLERYPNVNLIKGDIRKVIEEFPSNLFSVIHIYFPSPGPSHKRYIDSSFYFHLHRVVKKNGRIKIVTDVLEYYLEIQSLFFNSNWIFIPWTKLPYINGKNILVGTKCEQIFYSKYFLECQKI